jgi:hypothetical protein
MECICLRVSEVRRSLVATLDYQNKNDHSTNYRCDNRRFLVVRPRLSSPNHKFSKPRSRAENLDFWSRLTHQLLVRLKSSIPNLQICLPKKANSEKLGIDNPCRVVFLSLGMNKCLKRVDDRPFWNPGVMSYAMIPRSARCRPNSRVCFSSSHL